MGMMQELVGLGWRVRDNLRLPGGRKNVWQEVSGSLGDLGTFVPIVLAMALVNGVDLGTTLLFTGLYNLVTGAMFGVPMPVQPMKSIAAVAIAEGDPLTVPQIMAAGISTGVVLIFLGVTRLMTVVNRFVPMPVVRGIQLSQGISFGSTAVKYVLKNQDFKQGKSKGDREWLGLDGRLLALLAFGFVVLATGAGGRGSCACEEVIDETDIETVLERDCGEEDLSGSYREEAGSSEEGKRLTPVAVGWNEWMIPSALIVFILGAILAIARDPSILGDLKISPSPLAVIKITRHDWKTGFVRAAIPQIPLTILNSVIAVCKLSNDLFPEKEVSPLFVSTSVGFMNIVGCWFGAVPMCHGAGGLAGQYRFGARSGLSVAILGTCKLLLGLLLGSSLLRWLTYFPIGLLGVLLVFSGVELAMACRDQNSRSDSFVMLLCTVASLGSSSAAIGVGVGVVVCLLVKLRDFPLEVPVWVPWRCG